MCISYPILNLSPFLIESARGPRLGIDMAIRAWIFAFLFSIAIPAFAQESLLDHLNRELAPLTGLEKLFVIKLAENKITEQLQAIATDPAIKTEGPVWMMKVASFSYGTLSLLLEKQFPDVSFVYRERTEMYADVVRGKISIAELRRLEPDNEVLKRRALERELATLRKIEADPNARRLQVLTELGPRLGLIIAAHAIIRSTSAPK